MMEAQLDKKRAEVAEIGRMKERIHEILQGLNKSPTTDGPALHANGVAPERAIEDERRKREQRSMWQALETELTP